jgi:hypothetical protein
VKDTDIAMRRPPRPASKPFVTRQSTMLFSGIFLASAIPYRVLLSADSSGGAMDGLTAVIGATAVVTGMVAWIAAVVIALRSESLLWLVVAVLPIPPVNSLVCAMFCPSPRAGRNR